jgi:hypothetical protein
MGCTVEGGTYDLGDLFPSPGVLSFAFIPLFASGVAVNSEFLELGVALMDGANVG